MEPQAGRFVSVEDGRVLGAHGNAMFLTVGQGAKVSLGKDGRQMYVWRMLRRTDGVEIIVGGARTGHLYAIIFLLLLLLLRTCTHIHTHIPTQPHKPPPPPTHPTTDRRGSREMVRLRQRHGARARLCLSRHAPPRAVRRRATRRPRGVQLDWAHPAGGKKPRPKT